MRIVYSRKAEKEIGSLTRMIAERIRHKIRQYAADPASLANQIKKLEGSGHLRLRVGDYRVIFTKDGIVMMIIKVGHRRNVYH